MELYRLIYTSYRKRICDEAQITQILDTSRKNNKANNITGVLLYADTRFVQYLEGDFQQLQTLYDKIKSDERHISVTEREFDKIEERMFPRWNMGYRDMTSELRVLNETTMDDLKDLRRMLYSSTTSDQGLNILRLFFKMF